MRNISAVYYVEDSSPNHMYVLYIGDIPQNSHMEDVFEEKRIAKGYPPPSSEVIFFSDAVQITQGFIL